VSDPTNAPDWEKALAALRHANTVTVATHINPDGDALGSLLGAAAGLGALGKTVFASWGESGTRVPDSYAFLPGADSIVEPQEVPATDVFLALDCGGADRLGDLEPAAAAAGCSINIDHHPGNDLFGTLNVVVEDASSTAEIVVRLLEDLGAPIDRDIATCLYTGIVTDTGCFQYANATPDVLVLAAGLLRKGVDAPRIAQEVFESAPFNYLKLTGIVLERARLDEDRGFVYSWLTLEDLAATGVGPDETDKLIDSVRATRAADVAAIFKERPDGTYRVSLRSKGPRSVGVIARTNGGGGHELAAGFTVSDVAAGVELILDGLARQGA